MPYCSQESRKPPKFLIYSNRVVKEETIMAPNPLPEFPLSSPSKSTCSSHASAVVVDESICPPGLNRIRRQNRIYKDIFTQVNLPFPQMDKLGEFKIPRKRPPAYKCVYFGYPRLSNNNHNHKQARPTSPDEKASTNDFSGRSMLTPYEVKTEIDAENPVHYSCESMSSLSNNFELPTERGITRIQQFKSEFGTPSVSSVGHVNSSLSSFGSGSMPSSPSISSPKGRRHWYKFHSAKNDVGFFSSDDDDDADEGAQCDQADGDREEKFGGPFQAQTEDNQEEENGCGLQNGHDGGKAVENADCRNGRISAGSSDQESTMMVIDEDVVKEIKVERDAASLSPLSNSSSVECILWALNINNNKVDPDVIDLTGNTDDENENVDVVADVKVDAGVEEDADVEVDVDADMKVDYDCVLTVGLSETEQSDFLFD